MAQLGIVAPHSSGLRLTTWPLLGFAAGFLATLTLHQIGLGVLHLAGMTPAMPWPLRPVPPFGVPAVVSLAFWGGIWGIILAYLVPLSPGRPGRTLAAAVIFGAVFPTLAAWFIVMPLKGLPAGGGFHFPGVLVGPIVNGLWGLGAAAVLAFVETAGRQQPA